MFSSNLNNFENNKKKSPNIQKKIQRVQKCQQQKIPKPLNNLKKNPYIYISKYPLKNVKNPRTVKKSKNLEKFQKIFVCDKKNANLFVLPIEEISLWPELSSPPPFRILRE